MRAFFYEQLFPNIAPFLKQGISPTKLASGFSLGTVIGTMPMFFVATPLCAILAYFFGINQVIVQIANHSIGYPLQILLFYPFTAVGSLIIFREHRLNHEAVTLLFTSGFHCITSELGIFIAQALIGWLLLAPLIFLLLFVPSYFIFQRLKLPVNTK